MEFSEVQSSKLPRSGTYLLAEWGRAASRSPKRSALSTFVARIRCKRLRLATAELPENFGILRTSALRRSEKFAKKFQRSLIRVMRLVPMFASLAALFDLGRGEKAPPFCGRRVQEARGSGAWARTSVVRK